MIYFGERGRSSLSLELLASRTLSLFSKVTILLPLCLVWKSISFCSFLPHLVRASMNANLLLVYALMGNCWWLNYFFFLLICRKRRRFLFDFSLLFLGSGFFSFTAFSFFLCLFCSEFFVVCIDFDKFCSYCLDGSCLFVNNKLNPCFWFREIDYFVGNWSILDLGCPFWAL